MKKLKEIILNTFQLNVLLNEEEKEGFNFLLNEGVYCSKCNDTCKAGVKNYSIKLDSRNDVVINGECGTCSYGVCRVMEFGEDRSFFERALEFRKSIQN